MKIILPWLYFNLLPYSNGLKKRKLKKQIEVKCYVQNTNENKHNYNQEKFYRTQIKIIKHYTFLKYLYVWRDFFLFRSNMVVAMVTLDWWRTEITKDGQSLKNTAKNIIHFPTGFCVWASPLNTCLFNYCLTESLLTTNKLLSSQQNSY